MIPKFEGNQFKQALYSQKASDIDRFFDSHFTNVENSTYEKSYSKQEQLLNVQNSGMCDEKLEDCQKSNFQNKYSKQNHLTVMSYNIWNMNAYKKKDGAYMDRMNKLKQVCW